MSKFKNVEDLEKYVDLFDSDMRTLILFLDEYNGKLDGKYRENN